MKAYKISQELKPYIRLALAEQRIAASFFKEENTLFVKVPLSGEKFHKVVLRARCKKLTEDTGIIHLTKEEEDNPVVLHTLLPKNGGRYIVIGPNNRS